VDPTPGGFLFKVGDMLSPWTGEGCQVERGVYISTVHRVGNKNPVDRYSQVFLFDGSLDCPLDPLDGSGDSEKKGQWTVEKPVIKFITDGYGTNTAASCVGEPGNRNFAAYLKYRLGRASVFVQG
jgi:isopenicillin N synthase-like dioxygenase